MRWRPLTWLLLSILFFIGAFFAWRLGDQWEETRKAQTPSSKLQTPNPEARVASTNAQAAGIKQPTSNTNGESRFQYRLSNTSKTVAELVRSDKAILLE